MTTTATAPRKGPPQSVPVAHEGQAITIALLISLVAHLLVAYLVMDMPLGRVDENVLREFSRTYPVERATRDSILEEGLRARLGDRAWSEDRNIEAEARAMLAEPDVPAPAFADDDSPIRLDALVDLGMGPAMGLGEIASADVPEMLTRDMLISLPMGDGAPESPGGGGGRVASDAAARGQARSMLAEAGRGMPSASHAPSYQPIETHHLRPDIDLPATLATRERSMSDIDLTEFIDIPILELEAPQSLDDDFEYRVSVLPPGRESGYVRIDITPQRTLRRLRTMPKDVVFLVDTSISVPPSWVRQVIQGLNDAVGSLNDGDRFNIVLFRDQPQFFSEDGPVEVSEQSLRDAAAFLRGTRPGGMTDVNRAMSRLLVRDTAMERVYNLVLISDGQPTIGVIDTRELLNIITRDNDMVASIYCVGIGNNPNRELLEFLSYRNRGFTEIVRSEERTPLVIRDLMSRIRFPIMKEVELTAVGLTNVDVYPKNLPDVHQGQTFSIYARFNEPGPFTMRLAGHNGRQLLDFTFTRDVRDSPRGDAAIAQQWGFWKLHHLYSEVAYRGETPEIRRQIQQLRDQFGLKTVY